MSKSRFLLAATLWACAVLPLLAQAPSSTSSSSPRDKGPVYVRRFSFGAKLTYNFFAPLPDRQSTSEDASVPAFTQGNAEGDSRPLGYGAEVQVLLTNRFAVNANVFYRRAKYKAFSETAIGRDLPTTPQDDRTFLTIEETTKARFYDLPVTLRYFTKDRRDPGVRGFVGGGGVIRRVSAISTSRTVNGECCDTTPVTPKHRHALGFVATGGVQFNDDFGIKITPEVRYTYWVSKSFDAGPVRSNPHQLEAMLSITF